MKSHNVKFIGSMFFLVLVAISYYMIVVSNDVRDCTFYLNDQYTFFNSTMKQKAYDSCIDTPYSHRDDAKYNAFYVVSGLLGFLMACTLLSGYLDWKKESKK